jgi:hypothetical protein
MDGKKPVVVASLVPLDEYGTYTIFFTQADTKAWNDL